MPKYRREITIPDQFSSVHSLVINSLSSLSTLIADITNDDKFASMLENKIQVSAIKSGNVNSNQGKAVDALYLSKGRMISPERSKNTVRKTTQRGIRIVMNPQMSRQYPSNDRMLRYPCLPHQLFTDILISGTVSKCRKNNAQVYGTYFG